MPQQLAHEWALFGFPLSCHPLDLFDDVLTRIPHIFAKIWHTMWENRSR